MRPAAARLFLFSSAGAYRRLVAIVAGIALGTGMLLVLLGAYLHMPDRDERVAWKEPNSAGALFSDDRGVPLAPVDDTVLLANHVDFFDGATIETVSVASSAHTSVAFPDGIAPPAPGEYYASPAMARLIDQNPADQLGGRYGKRLGVLPASMLKGPSQRIVLIGANWDALAGDANATAERAFATAGNHSASLLYQAVLAIGSVALLVPIVLLISIVSQLGAAERRERFATVRLIGAGRRDVAALAGREMGLASLAGGLIGIGVAALLRPAAAVLSIGGATSYRADLVPSFGWTAASLVIVAALGAGTAWWRTFRDDVGALGATRERPEKRTTGWRAVPLGVGLTAFCGSAAATRLDGAPQDLVLLGLVGGFALTAFGIVHAGPWITKAASQTYRRLARSAAGVVAAGRLSRHPRATFRSVAGVVVAVFIVSMLAGVLSSVARLVAVDDTPGLLRQDTLIAALDSPEQAGAMLASLASVAGVREGVVAYRTPRDGATTEVMTPADARAVGAIDVPDAPAVTLDLFDMLSGGIMSGSTSVKAPQPAPAIAGLAPEYVLAVTDGSPAAIERARTAMIAAGKPSLAPTTRSDFAERGTLEFTQELSALAYIGMAIAIGISALALAVATVAAALDRKRTFGLLRLGGMPVSELRKSVTAEAALPLGATLAASAALGFFVAWVMVGALGDGATMAWPDARYWWALGGSLAIAALAVTGSFGVVSRSTEVVSTRFE